MNKSIIPINDEHILKDLSMTGDSNIMKQLHPDEDAWKVTCTLSKIIINVEWSGSSNNIKGTPPGLYLKLCRGNN